LRATRSEAAASHSVNAVWTRGTVEQS